MISVSSTALLTNYSPSNSFSIDMFNVTDITKKYNIPVSYFANYVCSTNIRLSSSYKQDSQHAVDLFESRIRDNLEELHASAYYSDELLFSIVSSVCAHELAYVFTPYNGEDLSPKW